MTDRVKLHIKDGVAEIILDDGKVNAMSPAMLRDIDEALDVAASEKAIVVIRSRRPRIFSAGFDLKIFASGDFDASLDMTRAGAELALRLLAHPDPVIGVVEGHAFPMGAFLLLACDVRIGARGDYRMGLNEVAIAITPPGFAVELARSRLHPAWLSRTVAMAEMFTPDDAVAAGMLDKVVDAQDVEAELARIIGSLRMLHRPSHARAKARLRQPAVTAMRAAIDRELTPEEFAKTGPAATIGAGPLAAAE